jgi:hypothetical protein
MDRMSFKMSMSYLLRLAALSSELGVILSQEQLYWSPENPPVTTIAAALAKGVQHNVHSFRLETLAAIFAVCEEAIQNGGAEGDAFATGFLETLQNAAGRDEFDFNQITTHLGSASKAHCIAMDKFYGVPTSGL